LTTADIQSCGYTNISITNRDGANGTWASDDYIGIRFTATKTSDGQTYNYEFAVSGVTGTTHITTETLAAPANAAPTSNAGPDQPSVASGATVTLDGTGSSDSDGTIASYAWTRTGGTGGAITLSDATAQSPTFTADTLTSNDVAVTHIFSLVVTDNDGATSTTDTVTITVQPPANAAPTANAGPDQSSVASAATVTLDGTGSSDSDGTIASYAWTRTGGTGGAITLSSTSASQPTFTADTLAAGAASVTHVFSLIVTDNDGTTSTADTVTITVNSGPTVAISGLPTDYSGVDSFDVTITFSKSVTGFIAGDIAISGGSVTSLSGSGATYTASITTSGDGDLSLSVPVDVANDSNGNGNAASGTLAVSNTVVDDTQQQTTDFMQSRASNIIATTPNIGGFLGGGTSISTRGFYLDVKSGNGVFALAGSLSPYASTKNHVGKTVVWYQLRGVHSDASTNSSDLAIGYIGGHRFVSENALVGAMLLADFASGSDSASGSSGNGKGFMIGPYFAVKAKNTNLRFEGQAMWGKSFNSISPTGTYTDQYTTDRWMARGKVESSFQRGEWQISPAASLSYFNEEQAAYTDSLLNVIPAQRITLGEAQIGPKFQRSFALDNGTILGLKMGASAVTNFSISSTSGSLGFPVSAGVFRTRVDLGINTQTRNGWDLSVDGFYDGLGVTNYRSYGVNLRAGIQF